MIDPTAILAELAAIQRDVRTVAADQNLALLDGKSERAILRLEDRIAALTTLMSSIAAPPLATGGPEPVPHSGAVCSTCGDTHRMWLFNDSGDSRQVMCTCCPRPCQSCRLNGTGPYCATTPCACSCHAPAAKPAAPPPVDNGMLAPIRARLDAIAGDVQSIWNVLSTHADAIAELRGKVNDHG